MKELIEKVNLIMQEYADGIVMDSECLSDIIFACARKQNLIAYDLRQALVTSQQSAREAIATLTAPIHKDDKNAKEADTETYNVWCIPNNAWTYEDRDFHGPVVGLTLIEAQKLYRRCIGHRTDFDTNDWEIRPIHKNGK